MNLSAKRLDLAFGITVLLTLLTPILVPAARLDFFAPYLIIVFYKCPRIKALWIAAGCGLFLDLLSTQSRLGIHALSFVLATAMLYPQRRHFFADSMSTLPIMTFLFSILSTISTVSLSLVLERDLLLTKGWVVTDLLIMPFFDAAYAFFAFILPLRLFGKRPRRAQDYFLTAED